MRWLAVLLVAAVLAWIGIGSARANGGMFADQGAAYAACKADSAAVAAKFSPGNPPTTYRVLVDCQKASSDRIYSCYGQWVRGGNSSASIGCPTLLGQSGADSYYRWPANTNCSSRSEMQNVRIIGDAGACSGGCEYAVSSSGPWESVAVGGVKVTKASSMLPTGQTCTVGDATNPSDPLGDADKCVQDGTLTHCVRADGKHCATASTGATFCWSPGESGVKKADNGNQAATKSPENTQINAPKDAPKNGGDWTVTGQGQVTTSSSGGSTVTNNVTTFDSSYGKQGTGEGDGTGSGSGDGDGDGDGDDDGPGDGAEFSDLYEKTDKTVEGVLDEFAAKVQQTAVVGGIGNFMSVPSGGSCPVFTLAASAFWDAMVLDMHCQGDFLALLRAGGWLIFAVACYCAIRIAVT